MREGLDQIAGYMDGCAAQSGHLVIFDWSEGKQWEDRIFRREASRDGRTTTVWGM